MIVGHWPASATSEQAAFALMSIAAAAVAHAGGASTSTATGAGSSTGTSTRTSTNNTGEVGHLLAVGGKQRTASRSATGFFLLSDRDS